jgi:predicted amino acid racemase
MFLNTLLERNPALAEFALDCHRSGKLLPDTYLLDMDSIEENAALMLDEARKHGIRLYFMLKQIGRVAPVAHMLTRMGFAGAVCVDFREALTMLEHGVPLGNVGHLVQTPRAALEKILAAQPEIVTIYSLEKAREIGEISRRAGRVQAVMPRVIAPGDILYPGQYGGFWLTEFERAVEALEKIEGIRVAGVCNFPCLLFDEQAGDIVPTPNLETVTQALALLRGRGYGELQINLPSASCVRSLPLIAQAGGTHAEPGHGLTGSTPYHALPGGGPERLAFAYLSEISHNLDGKAYCYGGGYYRRGHLRQALVGDCLAGATCLPASGPSPESIDYHFELGEEAPLSQGVIMCFRTQFFVTRSEVALVRGLRGGEPRIESIWSSQGQCLSLP